MSSLVFSVVALYFNFITYKEFKQIAFEIYREENMAVQVNDSADQR